jgi:hypothetical protein
MDNWRSLKPAGEKPGGMMTGKTPYSSTRALWKSYYQRHLVAKQLELAKEMINFASRVPLSYFKVLLTCCNFLSRGADGFVSTSKEGVLLTCIALKIYCCQPDLYP